jgi:hypothetical protein
VETVSEPNLTPSKDAPTVGSLKQRPWVVLHIRSRFAIPVQRKRAMATLPLLNIESESGGVSKATEQENRVLLVQRDSAQYDPLLLAVTDQDFWIHCDCRDDPDEDAERATPIELTLLEFGEESGVACWPVHPKAAGCVNAARRDLRYQREELSK